MREGPSSLPRTFCMWVLAVCGLITNRSAIRQVTVGACFQSRYEDLRIVTVAQQESPRFGGFLFDLAASRPLPSSCDSMTETGTGGACRQEGQKSLRWSPQHFLDARVR